MTGWNAAFAVSIPAETDGGTVRRVERLLPVAFWDDVSGWVSLAGESARHRAMVRASDVMLPGWEFLGYRAAPRAVGVLPGGGWSALFDSELGVASGLLPVLAWILREDASAVAVMLSGNGYTYGAQDASNFGGFVAPGGCDD